MIRLTLLAVILSLIGSHYDVESLKIMGLVISLMALASSFWFAR